MLKKNQLIQPIRRRKWEYKKDPLLFVAKLISLSKNDHFSLHVLQQY